MGHGDEVAFHFEGDRWDSSLNGGRGGAGGELPGHAQASAAGDGQGARRCCGTSGSQQGDRIALNMPNIMEQFYYTEAAKRLGIVYTPVFGGFSDKTLS